MAKRKSTRSQANDSSTSTSTQPKTRRSPDAAVPTPDTLTSSPDVERSENDDATLNAASGDEQPASAMSGHAESAAWATRPTEEPLSVSTSMGSEPSAEDIRMRAYHRFLERGASRGTDFEDWLEAERELKVRTKK
jgi:hypothetical protein